MTRLLGLHTRLLIAAIVLTVTAALPCGIKAQAAEPDSVTVSLVTYYPGSEIYELFGHTEVRVTDSNGLDAFFNYGVFDFNTPNFALRFASGETDYLCVAVPAYMERERFTPGGKPWSSASTSRKTRHGKCDASCCATSCPTAPPTAINM